MQYLGLMFVVGYAFVIGPLVVAAIQWACDMILIAARWTLRGR